MLKPSILRFSIFLPLLVLLSTSSYAAQVTLKWDPPNSGTVNGYRLYYGIAQGVYTDSVDVVDDTQYTLTGLEENVRYYIVAKAYNDEGESGNSNEVQWIFQPSDTEPPVVFINGPTETSTPNISLSGTAIDNVGVASVSWENEQGGNGVASGTENWTISDIGLTVGDNLITVSAQDSAGNTGSAEHIVNFAPSGDPVTVEFGNAAGSNYRNTIQDSFLAGDQNHSTNNDTLEIYTWPDHTSANTILVKCDLFNLPSGATIHDASVSLYMSGTEESGGDAQYEISVHKIVNHNPDISKCNWSTYDGIHQWSGGANGGQNDVAAAEDTQMVNKTQEYKSWNVTQMVRDWLDNPSSNFGMLLLSDQGTNKASADTNRIFVPTENADANKRPKLMITYSVSDPPEPPTGIRIWRINWELLFYLDETNFMAGKSF